MILKAEAKINISLDVTGLREDGYHLVSMVMQSLKLHDKVGLRAYIGRPGISFSTNVPFLPSDDKNLAIRAAELLMEEFEVRDGLEIELEKNIPVAAGLGGGSADAAAVLSGVNRLFHLGLSPEELRQRGLSIGADVPFCLMRGTALAEGIGEKLTPMRAMPACGILLAKPVFGASTKNIYKSYDALTEVLHPDTEKLCCAFEEGNLEGIASHMVNVLENVTGGRFDMIGRLENAMKTCGALGSMMTGSGPTVFGIYRTKAEAAEAARTMKREFRDVRFVVTEPLKGRR